MRLQVRVALRRRLLVRVAEQEELELRAALHPVTGGRGSLDLTLEDSSRRHFDRCRGLFVDEVAQHDRGLLEPGDRTQRREVGDGLHVAVALLPVGEPVTGHRSHLHVHREQVVARLDALAVDDVVEEVVPGHAFAHQATLEIGKGHEHGVDVAGADAFP